MKKLLRVNLKNGSLQSEPINEDVSREYIGARGIGAKYFHDELGPKVDPLFDGNKLFIFTGPVTGNFFPSGDRYSIITKSPVTGHFSFANAGGLWGRELKNIGYDGVIVEEVSEKPVYLFINSKTAMLKDASAIWGKATIETLEFFQKEHGKSTRILCISQGGEDGAGFSTIVNNENRAIGGRSGMGSVMGSKNIKAICISDDGNGTMESLFQNYRFYERERFYDFISNKNEYEIKSEQRYLEVLPETHETIVSICKKCPIYCNSVIKNKQTNHATARLSNEDGLHDSSVEIKNKRIKRTFDGKQYDVTSIIDSMGLCMFATIRLEVSDFAEIMSLCSEYKNYTPKELLVAGERVYILEREILKRSV